MAHASCLDVPASRWEWVVYTYCALVDDPRAAVRIRAYHKMMLVWWTARLARALHEVPEGLDRRLAPRPPDWEADMRAKYERYVSRAEALNRAED